MNVQQLRDAFAASVTLTERVRAFRTERVSTVSHHSTPVPIQDEGRPVLILHLIPLAAFASPLASIFQLNQTGCAISIQSVSSLGRARHD
jgi:hypothetical protein